MGSQESGRCLENRNREESAMDEYPLTESTRVSLFFSHEKARQSLIYSRLGIVGVCKKAKGGGILNDFKRPKR